MSKISKLLQILLQLILEGLEMGTWDLFVVKSEMDEVFEPWKVRSCKSFGKR